MYKLSELRKEDIPVIMKIETKTEVYDILVNLNNTYTPPLSSTIFNLSEYADKLYCNAEVYAAIHQGVLGFVAFYANDNKSMVSYITQIAVQPIAQNKHIGKKLLDLCFEISRVKGMKEVKLEVRNDNNKAISFYERNGFKYYSEASDDSMYLIKSL